MAIILTFINKINFKMDTKKAQKNKKSSKINVSKGL